MWHVDINIRDCQIKWVNSEDSGCRCNGGFTWVWTIATRVTVSVSITCTKKRVPFWWLLHQFMLSRSYLTRSSCMNVHATNVGLLKKYQSVDFYSLITHRGVRNITEKLQQTCSSSRKYIYICTSAYRQYIQARTVALPSVSLFASHQFKQIHISDAHQNQGLSCYRPVEVDGVWFGV